MSFDELIHTCSHEEVAAAAVFSLGLCFAGKVAFAARSHEISLGAFVVHAIGDFAGSAGDRQRDNLHVAMRDQDQPLLAGLRFILTPVIEHESRAVGYAAAAQKLGRPKDSAQCQAY